MLSCPVFAGMSACGQRYNRKSTYCSGTDDWTVHCCSWQSNQNLQRRGRGTLGGVTFVRRDRGRGSGLLFGVPFAGCSVSESVLFSNPGYLVKTEVKL